MTSFSSVRLSAIINVKATRVLSAIRFLPSAEYRESMIQKINTYHDLAKCNNGDILYFVHLPNAAVNLHQTIHYAIFCNVNNAGVQKNVIGINGLADLSFSPTAYHGVVASVISPGNFNGVGQVIYDTVAFPNILGELYVIDYELI